MRNVMKAVMWRGRGSRKFGCRDADFVAGGAGVEDAVVDFEVAAGGDIVRGEGASAKE